MNQVAKVERPGTPMPAPPMVAEMTRRFENRLDWPEGFRRQPAIRSDVAPSQDERRMLQGRKEDIVRGLVPARREEIGRMIASLRAVMPAQGGDDAELVVKLYMSALSRFPTWALETVCRGFLEGRYPGHEKFAPTPDQIAIRARALVSPFEHEIATLDKILRAEVRQLEDASARERIAQGLQELAGKIGLSSIAEEEERREAARKRMAEVTERQRREELERAGINDGFAMSLSLRRQLGLINPQTPSLSDD